MIKIEVYFKRDGSVVGLRFDGEKAVEMPPQKALELAAGLMLAADGAVGKESSDRVN